MVCNENGVHHNAINLLLYLRTLREKYIKMYEEVIMQLCMYAKAIRIWQKDIYQSLLYHQQNYKKF